MASSRVMFLPASQASAKDALSSCARTAAVASSTSCAIHDSRERPISSNTAMPRDMSRAAKLVQELCRTLDIGEEEGDGAGGEVVAHAA